MADVRVFYQTKCVIFTGNPDMRFDHLDQILRHVVKD